MLTRSKSARVHNLLLGLVRELKLAQPDDAVLSQQFFVGTGDRWAPLGAGFALTWWETKKGERTRRALVKAIREHFGQEVTLNREDVSRAVDSALQNNVLNRFLINSLFRRNRPASLFEAYSDAPVDEMANILWSRICADLRSVIDEWLFVYPLRISLSTTKLPVVNATVVAAQHKDIVGALSSEFPGLQAFSLETGRLAGDITLSHGRTLSWLFIRVRGAEEAAFSAAVNKASMLLGLIASFQRKVEPHYAFAKSMADTEELAGFFSHSCATKTFTARHCGVLFHPVLSGYTCSSETLMAVNAWLERWSTSTIDTRRRAEVAARWINQAAVGTGNSKFLFLFFALDALYGERSRVEDTIGAGVGSHMGAAWEQKCRKLFDLRSDLVHGGSASIDDWLGIERYRDHFASEPEKDIEGLSVESLLRYV